MGKIYNNKTCSKCKIIGRVIESWGVYYCKSCYDKRPKKQNGHSGMILTGIAVNGYSELNFYNDDIPKLEKVPKGNSIFCDLYLTHYPESKGIMGRSLNYIIWMNGKVYGIIGANSPPLNYKLFRSFFNTDNENLFLNNNVFRLIISPKNFGTKILAEFRRRIFKDYLEKYNIRLLGLCTFVEPPRSGAIYKADNWTYLGETQGKSVQKRDMDTWTNKEWKTGVKKLIFAKKYNIGEPHLTTRTILQTRDRLPCQAKN